MDDTGRQMFVFFSLLVIKFLIKSKLYFI